MGIFHSDNKLFRKFYHVDKSLKLFYGAIEEYFYQALKESGSENFNSYTQKTYTKKYRALLYTDKIEITDYLKATDKDFKNYIKLQQTGFNPVPMNIVASFLLRHETSEVLGYIKKISDNSTSFSTGLLDVATKMKKVSEPRFNFEDRIFKEIILKAPEVIKKLNDGEQPDLVSSNLVHGKVNYI